MEVINKIGKSVLVILHNKLKNNIHQIQHILKQNNVKYYQYPIISKFINSCIFSNIYKLI